MTRITLPRYRIVVYLTLTLGTKITKINAGYLQQGRETNVNEQMQASVNAYFPVLPPPTTLGTEGGKNKN